MTIKTFEYEIPEETLLETWDELNKKITISKKNALEKFITEIDFASLHTIRFLTEGITKDLVSNKYKYYVEISGSNYQEETNEERSKDGEKTL